MEFEAVIGLEVHCQLRTNTKIFCSCSTDFGAPPNTHTCPVCLGMPGVLPVLNKQVVDCALQIALATNCTINLKNVFARKHYFYPDLPKGYQISQYELPIAEHGWIEIETEKMGKRTISITRIHMEEDAGKLIHHESRPVSYVDLNRTGTPLLEIVSEPDIRTPDEAGEYLRRLRELVRYLGISDGNMEEGSLRCDANVSLRPKGETSLGTKAEVKNMNSFKHVQRALEYEIRRQTALLLDGKEVVQETRLWDDARGVTLPMRGKEEAHDYRYFPDPDLVPIVINDEWIASVKKRTPELPHEKRRRFFAQYGLAREDVMVLTSSRELALFFEDTLKGFNDPKKVANWIMVELMRLLNQDGKEIHECRVRPGHLAELLTLMEQGTISGKMAKDILEKVYNTGASPGEIVQNEGLSQVSDEDTLRLVCQEVVDEHPVEVEKYRAGKRKVIGFLVGQVMRKTKGKANPQRVNEILAQLME